MKYHARLLYLLSLITSLFGCLATEPNVVAHSQHPIVYEQDAQLAFPGAIGYGRYTVGGKGGKELVVNRLDDPEKAEKGTLRWALTRKYPRYIRFNVSGVIHLNRDLDIRGDYLTVDGRTSPGGIVIRGGQTRIKADQVILRYLRFRPGTGSGEGDALTVTKRKNIIIDHCSMSWSNDEVGSFYNNENFTLQYSILAESLVDAGHHKGEHGYGGIWGGKNASFVRNVIVNHTSRNPRINGWRLNSPYAQQDERIDIRNNVIANWGFKSIYGAEGGHFDLVNNYFQPGPGSSVSWIFQLWQKDELPLGNAYVQGNYIASDPEGSADNLSRLTITKLDESEHAAIFQQWLVKQPFTTDSATPTLTPNQTFDLLITQRNVGATLPVQDSVDIRVLNQIAGTLQPNGTGMINNELDVIDSWESYGREFRAD